MTIQEIIINILREFSLNDDVEICIKRKGGDSNYIVMCKKGEKYVRFYEWDEKKRKYVYDKERTEEIKRRYKSFY